MQVAFRKNGKSLYARIIRIWPFGGAAGRYSHSELVFSDGRTFSSDEADGGTRWKNWKLSPDEWDLLPIPCSSAQEEEVAAFCANENGLKYDTRGICFSFLPVPIGWQSEERWFCSEICVAALQRIGILSGYTAASVSPNRLYKILKKELEGVR
jgi:hypothetical protein